MTLPIDPSNIESADYGEHVATLSLDHETAIEVVRAACEAAGMGIPVEFSPSELLNDRIDADREPYYVLGACNPAIADRALDVTPNIGGLFPCNMVVWESAPDRQVVYHVSIMRIARLIGLAPDDDAWAEIVAETGELTDDIYERLESHEAAT